MSFRTSEDLWCSDRIIPVQPPAALFRSFFNFTTFLVQTWAKLLNQQDFKHHSRMISIRKREKKSPKWEMSGKHSLGASLFLIVNFIQTWWWYQTIFRSCGSLCFTGSHKQHLQTIRQQTPGTRHSQESMLKLQRQNTNPHLSSIFTLFSQPPQGDNGWL